MSQRITPLIVDAPQLSRQWHDGRLGSVTGSNVTKTMDFKNPTKPQMAQADAFYKLNEQKFDQEFIDRLREYPWEYCLKSGIELASNSTRDTYKRKTVAERITKIPADHDMFISKAMLWGQQQERSARAMYQLLHKHKVQDAPLMLHPELMCGASPDGLVIDINTGELGNLEIKCLEPWNHLYKIIIADEVPDEYIDQIQMQMWIDGRDWCDFVGYDPRVSDGLHIFVKRVERDDFFIDNVLEPGVRRFLDECDSDERQLYAIRNKRTEEAKVRYQEQIK